MIVILSITYLGHMFKTDESVLNIVTTSYQNIVTSQVLQVHVIDLMEVFAEFSGWFVVVN